MFKKLQGIIKQDGEDVWSDFYRVLEAEGCIDAEYVQHTLGQDISNVIEDVDRMSLETVYTWLTWILRGERFCDGLFDACLADGTLSKLLKRGELLCQR